MLHSRDLKFFPRLQAAANSAPPMRLMEQGEPVQALQRALADLGYSLPHSFARGTADGVCGHETIRAIKEFQLRESLLVDGIAGTLTMHKLDHYLCFDYYHQSSMHPLLTRDSVILCPHGARVIMPVPAYGPYPTPEDRYVIAGCPFPNSCRKLKWLTSNNKVRFNGHNTLDRNSQAVCLNAQGAVNGAALLYQA